MVPSLDSEAKGCTVVGRDVGNKNNIDKGSGHKRS